MLLLFVLKRDLLDVANNRHDIESFEFRVDGVQAADEIFKKHLERLRQTNELFAIDPKRGDLVAAIVDDAHLIVLGRVACDRSRAVVLDLSLGDGTLEEFRFQAGQLNVG